jgi:DNA-binding transcriptional regulator YiaG
VSNIVTALKDEVSRIARKEVRNETAQLKKAVARYRSDIADLKRRLAAAEQSLAKIRKSGGVPRPSTPASTPEGTAGIRFSAKGFRTLRERLDLSGPETAKLLRVSVQTIYNWEAGSSKPREPQLSAITVLRKAGKREVAARLAELTA